MGNSGLRILLLTIENQELGSCTCVPWEGLNFIVLMALKTKAMSQIYPKPLSTRQEMGVLTVW